MSETKWKPCDDPEVLAAAVAAGVKVRGGYGPAWPSSMVRARDFTECIEAGTRYWLPADWQPTPEPPADDLRERIARAIYEEAHEQPWKNANHPDWVQSLRSADAVLAVLPAPPAPPWVVPPVPPWPGAVLSGLVDEDGVPTWLAQAGQVRGEQVRQHAEDGWYSTEHYGAGAWVEVRAPRPAAATERVQAWEAVRDGRQVVGASAPFEAHYIWRSGPDRAFIGERTMDRAVALAPDGTVEVLKDGDR